MEFLSLIFGKFAYRDARKGAGGAESDGAFAWRLGNFCHFALFSIEHFVNAIGSDGLFPEHVAWMIGAFVVGSCCMAVKNWSAKGNMFLGVAIATKRRVSTGQYELEAVRARGAEDREALTFAPTSHVVFELLVKTIVPTRIDDPFEDRFDDLSLIRCEEIAKEGWFGDVPIICDACSEETTVFG